MFRTVRAHCLTLLVAVAGCASPTASKPAPVDKAATAKDAAAAKEPNPAAKTQESADGEAAPAAGSDVAAVATPKSVELAAADGVKVFADLYETHGSGPSKWILLFHQAGWNAGEYAPIAPELQRRGYNVLALDQRSGGERGSRTNRTVDALGKSTSYLEAYPDLEAALAWAKTKGGDKIIVWGSSYSAALVFKLASEHKADIAAVLSFSPGEYIPPEGTVAGWAAAVEAPVFVTSAPGEEVAAARAILDKAASKSTRQFEPAAGVHGSSILRDDANAEGAEAAWAAVAAFLLEHG